MHSAVSFATKTASIFCPISSSYHIFLNFRHFVDIISWGICDGIGTISIDTTRSEKRSTVYSGMYILLPQQMGNKSCYKTASQFLYLFFSPSDLVGPSQTLRKLWTTQKTNHKTLQSCSSSLSNRFNVKLVIKPFVLGIWTSSGH